MNNIKIIGIILTVLGALIDTYIILKIIIEKKKILKKEKIVVKNNVYIILITINMLLFVICGFIRNFE